jgi:hypothetical protein
VGRHIYQQAVVSVIYHYKNPTKCDKVDGFIQTTTTKTGGQFWPIIKSVTIRIPRCGVCSSGITLVDLPGVGDANAARDKIAKEVSKLE